MEIAREKLQKWDHGRVGGREGPRAVMMNPKDLSMSSPTEKGNYSPEHPKTTPECGRDQAWASSSVVCWLFTAAATEGEKLLQLMEGKALPRGVPRERPGQAVISDTLQG